MMDFTELHIAPMQCEIFTGLLLHLLILSRAAETMSLTLEKDRTQREFGLEALAEEDADAAYEEEASPTHENQSEEYFSDDENQEQGEEPLDNKDSDNVEDTNDEELEKKIDASSQQNVIPTTEDHASGTLFRSGKGAADMAYEVYLEELSQWKDKHHREEMLLAKQKQKEMNRESTNVKKSNESDSDSDLDDVAVTSRYFRNESVEYLYQAACQRFKVTPLSQFRYQVRRNSILMTNLSLKDEELAAMCVALSRMEKLTEVDLSDNCIGYAGLKNLLIVLGNISQLETLSLCRNKLGGKGAKVFSFHLDSLRTLRNLNLSQCGFLERDSEYLACLFQPELLECLRNLDLSYNTLGSYGGEVLAPVLAKNNTLEILNLSWCDIRMAGAVAIGSALKENGSLDMLDLSHNGFGDEGTRAICESLKTNQALSILNLSANRIFLNGALAIGNMLGVNEGLKEINLDQNCLTCEGAEEILSKLKENENSRLTKIDMKNVSLTYKTAAAVLPSMQQPLLLRCDSFLLGPGRLKNQLDIPSEMEGRSLLQKLEAGATAVVSVFIKNQRVQIIRLAKEIGGITESKNVLSDDEMRAVLRAMPIDLNEMELTEILDTMPRNEDGSFHINALLELGGTTITAGQMVTTH